MKKFIFALFWGLACLSLSAQKFHHDTYTGTIGEKYPIIVWLQYYEDGTVKGEYYYKKIGTPLALNGKADKDLSKKFQIAETNDKGVKTGTFDISVKNGQMTGTWTSGDNKKSLAVKAAQINTETVFIVNDKYTAEKEVKSEEAGEMVSCKYDISMVRFKPQKNPKVLSKYTPNELFTSDLGDFDLYTKPNEFTCEFNTDIQHTSDAYQVGDILSIENTGWAYTGGAHGYSYAYTFCVNLKNGSPVKLSDIFDLTNEKEFLKLLDTRLKKTMEDTLEPDCINDSELSTGVEYERLKNGEPSTTEIWQNFTIRSSSIIFHQSYSVPHVAQVCGGVLVEVSFKDLQAWIKKEGLLGSFGK